MKGSSPSHFRKEAQWRGVEGSRKQGSTLAGWSLGSLAGARLRSQSEGAHLQCSAALG